MNTRLLVMAWLIALTALCCAASEEGDAANRGAEAVVVYNNTVPESKEVAEHYARLRNVPKDQIIGFAMPAAEAITRTEFRDKIQQPLAAWLENARLLSFPTNDSAALTEKRDPRPITARIRYAVLCWGVPLKIRNDLALVEEGVERLREAVRRNDAAVDSELALLPMMRANLPLYGPARNWTYGTTNSAALHPTNGILIVARLDGPTSAIARGLVDKALQAERDGVWGRAYFDIRGLTNGPYKPGDDWIRRSAEMARHAGFETTMDTNAETFSAAFPMSQIALYAGWYDQHVSGPFTRPKVEFMPGAIAYHLHSYSAMTLRSASAHWVGPLLDRGVTATMGCVEEPYLEGTPDVGTFFSRLLMLGFTFGEAAYASQGSLSWQTTVVGDPLYRPFGKAPHVLHEDLEKRKSRLVEWSLLRTVNQNVLQGEPVSKYIDLLNQMGPTRTSPVLLEKLGDLYAGTEQPEKTLQNYQLALEQGPSAQQQLRLFLRITEQLEGLRKWEDAYRTAQRLAKAFPDYPDLPTIYRKLANLADKLGKTSEKEQWESRAAAK
ncbi:MAG: TIGR03790 family protein [Pedosphaera sp.]|nr:TIGR03790 family protein [Pedosphaera sp.]